MLAKYFVSLVPTTKWLAAFVFVSVALLGCGKGEDRQARYMERANTYFAEENFEKARIELRNVLQINPKNADARYLLGKLSFQDGDVRKAYGSLLAALEVEPDHLPANLLLAEIFLSFKGFDQVLEYTNKVLNIDTKNAEAMGLKALALSESGDKEQALSLANDALALDAGNAPAVAVVVQEAFKAGDQDRAMAVVTAAQETNPTESKIAKMKISLLQSMGRTDQVEAELKSLVK